ncbi:MAG: AI-2E family transporter [Planctomycetes bacterium]|nr:AI-2E family transporter [Planctomycetota bacterium]
MSNTEKLRGDSALAPPLRALALMLLVVAIFYFAREVLLPFSLAVLLSFLLTPLATRLQRWGLGHVGGVVVTVILAFLVLGGVGYIVLKNAADVAAELPKYEATLVKKVKALKATGGDSLSKAAETLERVEQELVKPKEDGDAAEQESPFSLRAALFGKQPLPVQIVDTSFAPVRMMNEFAPVLSALGFVAIVVVFVIFLLLERESLRDRIIRLAGTSRVYVTTQALEDAATRVSRYLMMQLIINSIYGTAIGVGLYFIGLPNAVLWGLLATILRFIPYVGPIIAAVTPMALSLAVFDEWQRPLATIALFIIAELITNNILEPWLYGTSTGVSTLAIVTAAVFWTWLWGPVGLVLATPLTVCLTVMARHVPQLRFLNILLADEPPLELRYRFYQRLLAKDYEDAADVAGEFLRNGTLEELYESLLAPALALAERDRDASRLTARQEAFIYESIAELVDDAFEAFQLSTAADQAPEDSNRKADGGDEPAAHPPRIVCLASSDEADRIAAVMFARLLTAEGYQADAADTLGASEELLRRLDAEPVDGVAVSVIAAGGSVRLRNVCRRLRRHAPQLPLLAGVWNAPARVEKLQAPVQKAGADAVAAAFHEGMAFFRKSIPLRPRRPLPTKRVEKAPSD